MRIGVNLGPTDDWPAMLAAAKAADAAGFDSVGFLDHYHADRLEWPYLCGWSAYGALALATMRIHLVPMVLDRLNYLPGVLAKEAATLAILSGGRFELGIGAGDFFEEARAWGTAVPSAPERIAGLRETITGLRKVWTGEKVTFEGELLHLTGAACVPPPPVPPRVVVGAGRSRSLIRDAATYADELNVYADDAIVRFAQETIAASDRPVALSVFLWDWPEDVAASLAHWEEAGVGCAVLTFWHPFSEIERVGRLLE